MSVIHRSGHLFSNLTINPVPQLVTNPDLTNHILEKTFEIICTPRAHTQQPSRHHSVRRTAQRHHNVPVLGIKYFLCTRIEIQMERIFAKSSLRQYGEKHSDSEQYLKTWYDTAMN